MLLKNQMRKLKILCFFAVILLCSQVGARDKSLIVAITQPYPPFTYVENGIPKGIAIDLWARIAEKNHWKYSYVLLDREIEQHTAELAQNKYDVLLGPSSINNALINKVQYTVPYFINTINILSFKKSVHFKDVFVQILKKYLLKIIVIYVIFLIIYLHLVWLAERHFYTPEPDVSPDDYIPKAYGAGMWSLFCHHITFSDHFFERKKSHISRVLYIIYVYMSFTFLTIVGASLTSALTTVSLYENNTSTINEYRLTEYTFAYIKDRYFYKNFSQEKNISALPVDSMDAAAAMLDRHQVDGIINDNTRLYEYLGLHSQKNWVISSFALGYVFSYFVLAPNNPHLKIINTAIVEMQQSGVAEHICKKYHVPDVKYCTFY